MIKRTMWEKYFIPLIKKWFFSPFSNKVTRVFLYVGSAVVATPILGHLIIKVILLKFFDIDIPIDVPGVPAYATGGVLMVCGALHNLIYIHLDNRNKMLANEAIKERRIFEVPHDQKIIEKLIAYLPYENTRFWIESSPAGGIRRDFADGLEECEKFVTPPFQLYNKEVEKKKVELISRISTFNFAAYGTGYLGAQEDKTGKMYLPPYHWKIPGSESEERYYEYLHNLSDTGQELLREYDNFIVCVKEEGFIIGEI